MEFIQYSTRQNELIHINPAQVVALRSTINDDNTHATLEIYTSSSSLVIVQEFDDVDAMKEAFERFERLLNWEQRKAKPNPNAPRRHAKVDLIR